MLLMSLFSEWKMKKLSGHWPTAEKKRPADKLQTKRSLRFKSPNKYFSFQIQRNLGGFYSPQGSAVEMKVHEET